MYPGKKKPSKHLWCTISRIRWKETPWVIVSKFCLWVDIQDLITFPTFCDDRLRGSDEKRVEFPVPHWLASLSLQLSHYCATVWFIPTERCVFQVHRSVAVLAYLKTYGETHTGRRDSALVQVATRRSFGEWSQQTPTVKQCHRCLIPTGCQENRVIIIITIRQSYACIYGAVIPTNGMISPAAPPGVLSANLIYSHCCKVFYRVTLRVIAVLTVGRCLSVRLSVCHTTYPNGLRIKTTYTHSETVSL